jgi:putative ABC transport system ATP-binding protein
MNNSYTIRLENISKTYRSRPPCTVLQAVHLELSPGTFCLLAGPSGSGKTTLLGIMGGLESATHGHIWLEGQASPMPNTGRPHREASRHTGFIFQDFKLINALTAVENVALALQLRGMGRGKAFQLSRIMLARLGLIAQQNKRPSVLSGGEKQRVAIARALVGSPRLVLADEPTAQLDSETGLTVTALLKEITREYGATVLVATHDLRLATFADRVVHLEDGTIRERTTHDWSGERKVS